MTAIWIALGFAGGMLTGVLWREAYELITGKDDPMDLWQRLRSVHVSLLTAGLIASMVFTGIVGIRVMISDSARDDLVECVTDYNAAVGAARDSRSEVADQLATAETSYVDEDLRYQRGLLESLQTDTSIDRLRDVIADRIEATEEYRSKLDLQTRVRQAEPYPAPDFCEAAR